MPLTVGRSTRTVPAAIRRALVVRDRGCRFPGCDRPPAWADAHHLVHWADGGETDLENLVLLCRPHHRIVHEQGWTLGRDDGGDFVVAPP
jgi:5-methylcytosine-specific restriction endonuclease McrA